MLRRIAWIAVLGVPAWAQPEMRVQTRIVREYQENGQTKVQEFAPSFRVSDREVQVGDQVLTPPRIQDETAQQMFNALMGIFASQVAPQMSRLKSSAQPLEIRLEIPTLKEKLTIQVTPEAEP
jgi:hypothetical protein